MAERIPDLAKDSEWLRGEPELSFYGGDVGFTLAEEYEIVAGRRAICAAKMAFQIADCTSKKGPRTHADPHRFRSTTFYLLALLAQFCRWG